MRTRTILWLAVLGVAILGAVWTPTASGQAVYGSIVGTITDPQGAALANAKVTVKSATKGTSVDVTSNSDGNYTVTHLIPDTYNVRMEAQGFKAWEAKEVRVFADQTARLDGALQVGGASETVTVEASDIPLIKTDRADVATTLTDKYVEEIPLVGRNFTDLQLLTPGTQKLSWQHASSENPQGSTQIFINGQHFSGTSFQLDGTDNRDPILGIIVVNPNLESVTETKIATQNYDAEFGQAIAAVITTQTKSGSNSLHGSLFEFRRNDEWQARDPFTERNRNPLTGKYKPDALWNQFGGAVGGPIIKDKLFFFGDFQGTRQKVGRTVQVTVPTDLVRSTCLNSASDVCDLSEYPFNIYDPASGPSGSGRTQFVGNIIPKDMLSTAAINLLSLLPAPNTESDPVYKNNYTIGGTGGFDANNFDIRSDYAYSDRLHLFGRYSFQQYSLTGSGAFDTSGVAVGGRGLGLNGFAGQSKTRNQSLAGGFDYTFGSTLLTDFRFGWFKYRVNVLPNGVGTSPASDAGAPGLNVDNFYTSGMPAFFINGGGNTGDSEFGYGLSDRLTRCNCPLTQNEDQFQFVNNWTKIFGNHQFKFGTDLRYARNLRVPSDQHRAGELSYTNSGTGDSGDAGSGVALASFLLGWVHDIHRYTSSSTDAGERQKRFFFYGQDTWRVTPKLTVNYGLRWELYFPQTVTGKGKGGWLNVDTGEINVAGFGGIPLSGIQEKSLTNFAPRLGVAYQATPKTVVRAGFGRSFDIGVFGSTFGHSVTQNLPAFLVQQANAANDFSNAFLLDSGPPAPVFPTIPDSGRFPLPDGIFQRILPNKLRMPTVDAWNITVQRQVTTTLSAEIAYVGNKGTHVFAGDGPTYNLNQATVVGFTPGRNTNAAKLLYNRYPFQSVDDAGNCTSFNDDGTPLCWTQGIDFFGNNASNNYNGLQVKVEKRFSQGFQMIGHYTWSQAFNFDGDYFPIDPSVNYGPNSLNRRHVFVLTGLWELPFGKGKPIAGNVSRGLNYLIGGWQINTITNWSGGLPFSPNYAECGSDRDTGPCRPDMVGELKTGVSNTITSDGFVQYFDAIGPLANNGDTTGPWRRPEVGSFGTARRNSLRGPHFSNTDLSVFKNVAFTERFHGQFRLEFTNVFNHRNNGTPGIFWSEFGGGGGNCIDCGDGGRVNSLSGQMRQMQMALKLTF